MVLPAGTPVPREILEKEARDDELLSDRQLELFPAGWSPFGPNGAVRPTLVTTEGWYRLGAIAEDGLR